VNLLDRVLLARADEQTRGTLLPPDGRDQWAIGKARKKPGPKGPRRSLTADQARRLLRSRAEGETLLALSKRYGVAKGVVQAICDRKTYRDVEAA
jgi:hypothetical protein